MHTDKMYLVTDGSHSDYTIMGVFDSQEKAEAFRSHFNHDEIEEFDLNPIFEATETNQYLIRYRMLGYVEVKRVSNLWGCHDWKVRGINDRYQSVDCIISAVTEEEARSIGSKKIPQLLLGQHQVPYYCYRVDKYGVYNMWDQMLVMKSGKLELLWEKIRD